MPTIDHKRKKLESKASVREKLGDVADCINCSKSEGAVIEIFKESYIKNIKSFSLIHSLYSGRFLISACINMFVFILALSVFNKPPSLDITILIMVNYMIVSTLLLSSAIAFFLLNKMERLEVKVDDFCVDVKEFVGRK